ncbi:MAG TPA: hypothetical protein VFV23_02595 [Verrucomicrobiae bacterium]|nr:hypothetical protein [Verrucomicrobiae bacterium]
MRKITSAIILAAGAIFASQSAKAQFVANDLYLGFENGSASSDYIVNLGAASSLVGASGIVDLSSLFSLSDFNTVLGANDFNMMGVVGGRSSFPSSYDIYTTTIRNGGAGDASLAGSDLTGLSLNSSTISSAVGALTVLDAPAAGSGTLDSSRSWYNNVEPTLDASTWYGNVGVNPSSAITNSGVLYEDLWYATAPASGNGPAPTYAGFFTLDLTGGSPSLTFTPVPVPEPGTVAMASALGGAILLFRRRLNKKA